MRQLLHIPALPERRLNHPLIELLGSAVPSLPENLFKASEIVWDKAEQQLDRYGHAMDKVKVFTESVNPRLLEGVQRIQPIGVTRANVQSAREMGSPISRRDSFLQIAHSAGATIVALDNPLLNGRLESVLNNMHAVMSSQPDMSDFLSVDKGIEMARLTHLRERLSLRLAQHKREIIDNHLADSEQGIVITSLDQDIISNIKNDILIIPLSTELVELQQELLQNGDFDKFALRLHQFVMNNEGQPPNPEKR